MSVSGRFSDVLFNEQTNKTIRNKQMFIYLNLKYKENNRIFCVCKK